MNALDPAVYARPAYLPTGPREEYRPERLHFRRDEETRGGCAPARGDVSSDEASLGQAQASKPARPAMAVTVADSHEPVPAPSCEPSTSQEASAMQPTTSTSSNASTHVPLAGPAADDGESPPGIGEGSNENGHPAIAAVHPEIPPRHSAPLAGLPKKARIVEAVRQGHCTYTGISAATGLTKSEVSAVIHATLLVATKRRPAVLVEITPPGEKERRFGVPNGEAPGTHLQEATHSQPAPGDEPGSNLVDVLARYTLGTQKDRVLTAVRHGARTTTEIALRTGLLRDQISKTVCYLVKRGELRDLPNEEERTVELAPHLDGRKPSDHLPSARSESMATLAGEAAAGGRSGPVPPPSAIPASPVSEAPPPQTSPAPARVAQDPSSATNDLIDQLEVAATDALTVLRDAFSRLAGLARENAAARDRLTAVQKLLGGDGGRGVTGFRPSLGQMRREIVRNRGRGG